MCKFGELSEIKVELLQQWRQLVFFYGFVHHIVDTCLLELFFRVIMVGSHRDNGARLFCFFLSDFTLFGQLLGPGLLRASDHLSKLQAIDFGHLNVCQNQLKLVKAAGCSQFPLENLQCFRCIVTDNRIESKALEQGKQNHDIQIFVVHQQNIVMTQISAGL